MSTSRTFRGRSAWMAKIPSCRLDYFQVSHLLLDGSHPCAPPISNAAWLSRYCPSTVATSLPWVKSRLRSCQFCYLNTPPNCLLVYTLTYLIHSRFSWFQQFYPLTSRDPSIVLFWGLPYSLHLKCRASLVALKTSPLSLAQWTGLHINLVLIAYNLLLPLHLKILCMRPWLQEICLRILHKLVTFLIRIMICGPCPGLGDLHAVLRKKLKYWAPPPSFL
jgi:hypothetical protein